MHLYQRPPEQQAKALLSDCGLITDDIEPQDFEHYFGCGSESEPEGVVGLEVFGDVALLRSLAVAESSRGLGCGRQLVSRVEAYAAEQGIVVIYLLTETAEAMFGSMGYCAVERSSAPVVIRESRQFSSLCPASATFMLKSLGE